MPFTSPGRVRSQGETLAYFNDELSRELDVTIVDTNGQIIPLLFPGVHGDLRGELPGPCV